MFKLSLSLLLVAVIAVQSHKVEDNLNLNTDEKNQIAQIEANCVAESKCKVEDVHKFDKGEFTDSKELRCFYKCLLTSFGVMDSEGRIVHSKINLLVPDKVRSKAEHCFNREKGEPCDVAYETYKCYIQEIHL
ncbi:general odorant-binding protein 69a-like [Atheta coriaria]|uniref:general odorant-binding protein 69a-like n=1 Tax=Dalotia coriaria TaxID=877792 RepID=UPI0031F3FA99